MNESSRPPLVTADPNSNITDLLLDRVVRSGRLPVFALRRSDGTWRDVSAAEFHELVGRVAKGFIASGVKAGDRVGILSRTRYEWTVIDFALWFAGAISVPVYETSSEHQIAWNLGQTAATGVVVETKAHLDSVRSVQAGLDSLRTAWCLDEGAIPALESLGAEISDDELEERRATAGLQDTASIIFTSGTTGNPRGCELSHGNFVDLALNAAARLPEVVMDGSPSNLLFMPLAHVFARFIEVLNVATNVRTGFTAQVSDLVDDLGTFQPTFILAVPRVFEKVYNQAASTARAGGKGRIFDLAADVAVKYSESFDRSRRAGGDGGAAGPSWFLRVRHRIFDRLVYSKLRAVMGGRLEYAVSGGAALGRRLGHFYRGIGVTVLEGYGLTETTAPLVVNCPDDVRIGTVGPPLPGSDLRVADDGEIHVRGVGVFERYWNNPEATAEAFVDGWFATGDLGTLDEDGFLSIIGRKKEILVTAGGKNVSPAGIENRVSAEYEVAQCMLVGDGKPFVAALVTLDPEAVPSAVHADAPGDRSGAGSRSGTGGASHPREVVDAVRAAIREGNRTVSHAEQVKRFLILDEEFSEASGTMTPSLKLKRPVIYERFAADIESLYSGGGYDVDPR